MARWREGDGPIMALDMGTSLGFCIGDPGQAKPRFGTHKLGRDGATHDERWHHLREWFMDQTAFEKPWALCVESAMNVAVALRMGNAAASLPYTLGLHAIIREAAIARGIAIVRTVDVDDHRKHFLGRSRFSGGTREAKRAAIARCNSLGWNVPDDNAADACSVWDYACAIWVPKTAAQAAIMGMQGAAR